MKEKIHFSPRIMLALIMFSMVIGMSQLNAQTLTHSYDFETDLTDGTGSADATAFGSASVSDGSLVLGTDGDYISFDGAALGLNAYAEITLEFVYQSNNGFNGWNWSYYFGDAGGANTVRGGFYTWSQIVGIAGTSEGWYPTSEDGSWHHFVQVVTATTMDLYKDGVLLGSHPTSGLTIGTLQNFIGKGANEWADPTWMGLVEEFNIYEGAMDATTVADRAALYLNGTNANLATLTTSVGTLTPAFDPGIIFYGNTVPDGTSSVDISATTEQTGAVILSGTGSITLIDGEATTDIVVQAPDGVTTKTYTVNIKEECFEPLYPTGNLISDPTISDINNFFGWGYYAITTDIDYTYCGATSGTVGDNCGGSFNYSLNGMLEAGKTYQVRAAVWATTDQFKIGFYNAGSTSPFEFATSTTGEWEILDFTVTMASDIIVNDIGLYFNSCEGLGGTGGYIDNWELYEVGDGFDATLSEITISEGSLIPDFNPAITSYVVSVPEGTASVDVSATTTDPNATIESGTGSIAIIDGLGNTDILVTAQNGTTQLTYSIGFKEECYEPLYPTGNLVSDPMINDISNFSVPWGSGGINHNLDFTYCGASSGTVGDNCSGSFNYILNGMVEAGKTYQIRAAVYATSNQFKIGFYNAGSTSPFEFATSTTGEWEILDFTVTMADDINVDDIGMFFNSCEGLGGLGGYIDNWEMYEVEDGYDASLSDITLSEGSLLPEFSPGIFSYVVSSPEGVTSIDVSATSTDPNATIESGIGAIPIVDGLGYTDIVVTAQNGTTQLTYSIAFKEECFTPLYSTGNIVSDPTISDLSNFSGWGYFAINKDFDYTYCGATSGAVGNDCGGSFNYVLNGLVEPNKTYQVRAAVWADTNQFKIGFYNAGSTSPYEFTTTANDEWEILDFIVTLADDINVDDIGMYFNSCEGLGGLGGYIDNWEMYEVEDTFSPTVEITSEYSGTTNVSPIPVTISFNEVVTGFELSDIEVGNGSAGNLVEVTPGMIWTSDITPVAMGTVTVDIDASVATDMAGNGNIAAQQFSITYDTITGIRNNHSNKVLIYPNPATNFVTIVAEDYEWVEIFDLTGKTIRKIEGGSNLKINISDFDRGIYFVKFLSNDFFITQKFLVD